jgi:hypothetical protein
MNKGEVRKKKEVTGFPVRSVAQCQGSGLYICPFVDCEDSADGRIVEAQKACHLHLAITVGGNSFGDEPVPERFAWAFL